ncbi:ABC transporter permease subunit [Xanthomonas hortorum pv. vitians]|uniref:ABC transporter permease/M1 family aminopeptidase n=1 Tax=Xanthomonas hortorum TaxID=56454 RepID=UPI0012AAA991|nr:M1 family aminopeptidase [Xanthomonas hortorum]MCE4281627.1 ABC transporter permease subunit [Xanthomonas hortorum pv. vitians]MCE4283785.1 ABC transporter permease subunit [Xanthomonas hortorum pv. vitians]MCE4288107.1 ABC transporter permease subunit [Xanthomonas hortorum pv. vitians]MCE4292341.1 ABC transporter permease subunit [Xanthomonas hortorum pv. vitians]MDT7851973.1 M1 family aminopeptidase [Xanthomonas hortorum pv. vitians]
MILAFLRFELREQLRSPFLWLLAALYALLAFAALSSDAVQIGGGIGNVLRNAPTVIATLLGLFSLLGLLVITLFVSNALLRDFDLGTAELVFSTPVRRRDYLLGRIGAALIAGMVMYVVIALGMFAAQFMPWIDQARLGPVAVLPYLWSLLVLVLPNLLFTTALLSVLAVTTRSILWVYIGVIVFFVLYGVSRALMADLDNVWIATLSDPLGIRALSQTLRYWSVDQRNHQLPPLTGYLLANRAVWLGMSGMLFAATFALFRTERSGTRRRRGAASIAPADAVLARARVTATRLTVTPSFGAATAWKQLLRQIRFDTLGVLRSAPFVVLLLLGLANFIPTALFNSRNYGTAVLPVTSLMLEALQNSYSFLLIIVVLFYAGELVWKERSNRIDGITDAMPVPDWVPLLGKFVALLAVIASFQLAGALTSIALQLGRGYTSIEPLLYLKTLALGSVLYVLMGGMALALQVLSNNKFVGYALLMLVLIGQSVLSMLDYTQNLYTFGGWPNAPYSDMNGYGHFLPGQLWFQGYWGVFLLALLLLSSAFWPRGVGHGLRQRVRLALRRLRSPTGAALAASLLGFAAIGGWLYWNTNVYNSFLSPEQRLDLQARYERDYRKYKDLPQPRIVAIDNHVDLHPETQSVVIDATWTVRNTHTAPISEVHIGMQGRTGDRSLVKVDLGGQTLTTHDVPAGYRIYRLQKPLQPGEERVFRFRVDQHPHGLTAEQAQTELVANGSFFNNTLLPWFGYNTQTEITDRNDRRKRGLGEPTRMPKLEDQAARANSYVSNEADWLGFASTVCTAPDQIALAPGYLQKEFQRDGRRCFRYVMDRPMLNFYAYLSARWEVRKARYKNIPIEIYYDPKHPYNVQRMIESVQKSLAYYEADFSPYQHHQVRIIEFPGYARFAQSFANTIPYSESIGFIADLRDKNDIDYVFYVTAHEVAHQWWAHQVIGANVQGATMLSESLAQYSALMVMEREYGRAHMRRFLKYELDRYLEGRGGETIEELPLYRVEDQQYIHYRKGSLAFYRLREEIGEQALNRALQRFLAAKAFEQPPYTTSAELLQTIRAEARPDQQGLITDLFEKITFYDNRVVSAQARKRPDGRYEVTVQTHAAKLQADGKGKEHAVPLDDWIEVAIYGKAAGKDAQAPVLYLQRQHITSVAPSFTVTVDGLPAEAGFDPDNKLIDRVPADNSKQVTLQ